MKKLLNNEQFQQLKENLPSKRSMVLVGIILLIVILTVAISSKSQMVTQTSQKLNQLQQQNQQLMQKAKMQLELDELNQQINKETLEIQKLQDSVGKAREEKIQKVNHFLQVNNILLENE